MKLVHIKFLGSFCAQNPNSWGYWLVNWTNQANIIIWYDYIWPSNSVWHRLSFQCAFFLSMVIISIFTHGHFFHESLCNTLRKNRHNHWIWSKTAYSFIHTNTNNAKLNVQVVVRFDGAKTINVYEHQWKTTTKKLFAIS